MNLTEAELQNLLSRGNVKLAGAKDLVVRQPEVVQANTNTAAKKENRRQPNKTELAYMNLLAYEFPGCKINYEGISLRLENGSRYTPDIVVHSPDGLLLVEVKNAAYKHASYGRSRMAFNQCLLDFPQFKYRWTEKDKNTWNTRTF